MQFLTRNLVWKLLSLVVAFFFWLGVAREPDLATIISVPVEYNNFPGGLEISSRITESIAVEARCVRLNAKATTADEVAPRN